MAREVRAPIIAASLLPLPRPRFCPAIYGSEQAAGQEEGEIAPAKGHLFSCMGEPFQTEDFSEAVAAMTSPQQREGGINVRMTLRSLRHFESALLNSDWLKPTLSRYRNTCSAERCKEYRSIPKNETVFAGSSIRCITFALYVFKYSMKGGITSFFHIHLGNLG